MNKSQRTNKHNFISLVNDYEVLLYSVNIFAHHCPHDSSIRKHQPFHYSLWNEMPYGNNLKRSDCVKIKYRKQLICKSKVSPLRWTRHAHLVCSQLPLLSGNTAFSLRVYKWLIRSLKVIHKRLLHLLIISGIQVLRFLTWVLKSAPKVLTVFWHRVILTHQCLSYIWLMQVVGFVYWTVS